MKQAPPPVDINIINMWASALGEIMHAWPVHMAKCWCIGSVRSQYYKTQELNMLYGSTGYRGSKATQCWYYLHHIPQRQKDIKSGTYTHSLAWPCRNLMTSATGEAILGILSLTLTLPHAPMNNHRGTEITDYITFNSLCIGNNIMCQSEKHTIS
jgi:hypothetical protein